ncbi:Ribose transport system permease protein rbsC [Leclercia adecarboxylata]|uniref:Ribose transport system permease protein rbsC n=1 Tax=Leclercia adecarboxylata TaxID=83655 RepID=A0A4U9J4I2_9ENTR|nr:Ribose transport system permease protein rbsC [Leclercia adecarboxylata]
MTTQAVSGRRYFTKAWLLEQKSLIALLVLIAIVSTMSPNFFTVNNLFNILQQTSVNAIMAVGMTLVILTSGIDLSVGSLLALTGAVAASIVGIEVNALVAVAAALALGAAIGGRHRNDRGERPRAGLYRHPGNDVTAARCDHGLHQR